MTPEHSDWNAHSTPPETSYACPECGGDRVLWVTYNSRPDTDERVQCHVCEGTGTVSAREAFQAAHVCTDACLICPACHRDGLARCGVTCAHFQLEAA